MQSDFELLDSWRDGNADAGSTLFERHFASLYGFFHSKVPEVGDDLIQKTLLACVESRDRFRGQSSFRSYLFAVARNELYMYWRKQNRRGEAVDFEGVSLEDLGTTPSQAVAEKEEQRLLLRALRAIPVEFQVLFELYYWEELSGPELADVLGVPEGTARTRLRRARQLLEQKMAELATDPAHLRSTVDDLQRWARSVRPVAPNP